MKWVRQRCQAAPGSVAEIASTRPGCASELTSLTPARPRATRPRTNANQAAPSPAVTTSRPSDSRQPARLQQPVWEVAARAKLGHRELDRAHARVPVAVAVAVAAVDPLRRPLAVAGTADGVSVRAHQRLREVLHHRSQQIRVSVLELL